MSDPYVGEIRMFGGNFAPRGWAECNGQLLAVSQNDALFSLLGTIYGGDGRTTFGLPDLRGRVALHRSPTIPQGQKSGNETVSLTGNQNASHSHGWQASNAVASNTSPAGAGLAKPTQDIYHEAPFGSIQNLETGMVENAGSSSPHDNMMPYQVVIFIIALFGVYPSRS